LQVNYGLDLPLNKLNKGLSSRKFPRAPHRCSGGFKIQLGIHICWGSIQGGDSDQAGIQITRESRKAEDPDTAGDPEALRIQLTKGIQIKKLGRTQVRWGVRIQLNQEGALPDDTGGYSGITIVGYSGDWDNDNSLSKSLKRKKKVNLLSAVSNSCRMCPSFNDLKILDELVVYLSFFFSLELPHRCGQWITESCSKWVRIVLTLHRVTWGGIHKEKKSKG
jgi:hypothetical protein